MGRKTKVIGISLPPEINKEVEDYISKTHKTKSEFFRETIASFLKQDENNQDTTEQDLASILKGYWDVKASIGLDVIPIVLLVLTNEKGKILIGCRNEKDKWVDNLNWVFPGGRLKTLDIEDEVKRLGKKETGLEVTVNQLISARIHPDSGYKKVQIVALYFHCSTTDGKEVKPGGSLNKLKWIKPLEVFKYFTTSTCDDVTKFLTMIEKERGL